MTATNTLTRAFGDSPVPAFLISPIVGKDRRSTVDFCTTIGGGVRRRSQEAKTAKPHNRKQKAELRAQVDRRTAIVARDERLMLDLDTRGSKRHPLAIRFVERCIPVDYVRNGAVDRSLSTTVTVKCKVRPVKH